MSFIPTNPNPTGANVGDCVVRAIAIAENRTWSDIYVELCIEGLSMCDMPSSNRVWGELLKSYGYVKEVVPDTCPYCYTVKDFCGEHFKGTYILATGTHVICIRDGNYLDTWDSGMEYPIYYWFKEE